ncbi:calcium-binding protein [Actinoplanes xinjiangensis]|uniref:calcium-binding protein n=1 Tax=Actinoplanes xinjiangensis TaxID=512350 RepID=UPI003427775D
MNVKHLSVLGATAVAVASTVLFASPAQAASAGLATAGKNTVSFRALMGQTNKVSVTISGRTVTITDRVAVRAGTGCRSVTRTKVRCTTSQATRTIKVALGDGNDYVRNHTGVFMLAGGSTGNDTLVGGSGTDQLQGGSGNDRLYGGNGRGELFGDSGTDYIVGGTGYDYVAAGSGGDTIATGAGNDLIHGQAGNDTVYAGVGGDQVRGWGGDDRIWGGAGNDFLMGDVGNDALAGEAGDDTLVGEIYKVVGNKGVSSGSATAADRLYAGVNTAIGDICLESSSRGSASGCEWFTAVAAAGSAAAIRVSPGTPVE